MAIHHKDADQAHLILGVESYPLEHPDRYALQLLSAVLGSGMSSRLFLEVRERRGLAYYVHGLNHSYTDAGSLLAQAGVDLTRIDEAITVIAEQFARMADERVGSDELEKARSLIKGRFVLRTESPQGLIMYGLNREVLEGRALEPAELLAEIDAVSGRGRPAGGAGPDRRRQAPTRGDRPVRGPRRALRLAPALSGAQDRAEALLERYDAELRALLPARTEVFDAHLHLGHDIDGMVGDYDGARRADGTLRRLAGVHVLPRRARPASGLQRGERPHARACGCARTAGSYPSCGSTSTSGRSRRRDAASTRERAASSSTRARRASAPATRASSPCSRSPPNVACRS